MRETGVLDGADGFAGMELKPLSLPRPLDEAVHIPVDKTVFYVYGLGVVYVLMKAQSKGFLKAFKSGVVR